MVTNCHGYPLLYVDEALHHTEKIYMYTLIGGLASCEYEIAKFSEILDEVQKLVDNLNLHSYTNLTRWVNDLDLKVTAGVICTCTLLYVL